MELCELEAVCVLPTDGITQYQYIVFY